MPKITDLPKGLVPFDPKVHKAQDLGLGEKGSVSTEFLVTMDAPNGGVWNIPSIWFNEDGKAQVFDEQTSARLAFEHEKGSAGKGQFHRFNDIDSAVNSAIARSKAGGASKTPLFELIENLE